MIKTEIPVIIATLKERRDFLRVRQGQRARFPSLVLEAAPTPDGVPAENTIRVGYTCTKRLGNAVRRNRIKRRLRAAARDVLSRMGQPGNDYVIIGKVETADLSFTQIVTDLEKAVGKVHDPRSKTRSRKRAEAPRGKNSL